MHIKILVKVTIIFIIIIINSSCSTKQGFIKTKESPYELNIKKTSLSHDPVIYGYVYEFGTKNPVLAASVWNDKHYENKIVVDVKGKFKYIVKPGKHKIWASFVGFRPCTTNSFEASKGDTIKIDFYLKIDTNNFHDPVIKTKKTKK
ncbi:hypothetical protein HDE69_000576 [Pedobacter cryoconitis]|uniref:Carboxypeptidase regulatory-like domain-containing protein n=1 Tax=Pedobacter cryoconitis TaxID=188932 RepID=A0A7W9DIX1_9SPHI|nr:carboxypeptidase-like regulatory domain-containing protein [Pedobacter cryoconitis]MBB5619540.1 hypothetical protein [Pedobacter cryoconitis]